MKKLKIVKLVNTGGLRIYHHYLLWLTLSNYVQCLFLLCHISLLSSINFFFNFDEMGGMKNKSLQNLSFSFCSQKVLLFRLWLMNCYLFPLSGIVAVFIIDKVWCCTKGKLTLWSHSISSLTLILRINTGLRFSKCHRGVQLKRSK